MVSEKRGAKFLRVLLLHLPRQHGVGNASVAAATLPARETFHALSYYHTSPGGGKTLYWLDEIFLYQLLVIHHLATQNECSMFYDK
jgi:hypothetical protein